MPAATQWELVEEAAEVIKPAHDELVRQTAQGEVLVFLDSDTHMPEELLPCIHQAFTVPGRVGGAVDMNTGQRSGASQCIWGYGGDFARRLARHKAQHSSAFATPSPRWAAMTNHCQGEDVDFCSWLRRRARDVGGQAHFIESSKWGRQAAVSTDGSLAHPHNGLNRW